MSDEQVFQRADNAPVAFFGHPGRPGPTTHPDCTILTLTEPGDDAVVFDAAHPVQQFAKDLGTIPYEALTSISQRVKRVYVWG